MKISLSKRNLVLLAAIVLVAVGLILIPRLIKRDTITPGSGLRIRVLVNGRQYLEEDLMPGRTIEIAQENGSRNVVMMTENGFHMESSTCKNQDCVLQGEVTSDNYYQRILGTSVICLPNRVEVQLIPGPESPAPEEIPDA